MSAEDDYKYLDWLYRTMRSILQFSEGVLISDNGQVYAYDPKTGLGVQFSNECNKWLTTQNREKIVSHLLFTSMQDLSSEYKAAVEAQRVYPPLNEPARSSSWDRIKNGFGL